MTDDDEASDRTFDIPSFIINIKLLGVCFNIALIVTYFRSFTLFVADALEFALLRGIKLQKQTTE